MSNDTGTNAGESTFAPGNWRKKPVVIEAAQLTRDDAADVIGWMNRPEHMDGEATTVVGVENGEVGVIGVEIETLEGVMTGDLGDWIIKGVAGEFYPCKPEIFEQTYEAADHAG